MNKYQEILKQYWGYDSFRDLQEEIITSIGEGKDTLGLMPTGGGKSITFQVPALAQEGICIVITPLIALMKDQVQNLRKRGIKALAIYSGMTRQEILTALENCIFGNYKFLYISPERLDTDIFRTKLRSMKVSMITVDESHCISQWGYDFRPAYLKIAEIRTLLPGTPVLALTATATPEVVKDIQARLDFREENVFRMSFERKNLAYIVRQTDNKTQELLHILRKIPGSAIIYVRNRRRTKEITELLVNEDITADFYHAGLDNAVKEEWEDGLSKMNYHEEVFAPSKEDVMMLEPDMIFSWGSLFGEKKLGDVDQWISRGTNTYINTNTRAGGYDRTLEHEYTDILNIGKIFDVEEKAQALVDEMKQEIEDALAKTKGKEAQTVSVIEFLNDDISNYGASSLAGDMITQLGGELAAPDAKQVGKEDLVEQNPDVIFVVYMENSGDDGEDVKSTLVAKVMEDPSFASLDAVKNGRVYPIMLGDMYASGARTIDGIRNFAAGLYPELNQ